MELVGHRVLTRLADVLLQWFFSLIYVCIMYLISSRNRARKCVTINGVTPRDWSSLGSKGENWGLE